jgi:hypothetical protein
MKRSPSLVEQDGRPRRGTPSVMQHAGAGHAGGVELPELHVLAAAVPARSRHAQAVTGQSMKALVVAA